MRRRCATLTKQLPGVSVGVRMGVGECGMRMGVGVRMGMGECGGEGWQVREVLGQEECC